jgi:type IV secretory pathway TrbF-like protein
MMSMNGAATALPSTAEANPDEAAQRAGYAENSRKAIDAATWRRVASGAIVLAFLALVAVAILANKYTHDVFVFERTPHGLVYNGQASEELTPSNFDIASQLGYWVRAKRDVPGDDLMVDRNVELLEATTADYGQDHALSDLKSELSANNPKIERKDYTRTVDPNVDALHQPGTNTWLLTWIEYVTKKNGTQEPPSLHHGEVVILPDARIPTDNEHVDLDPAGVTVVRYELH